MKLDELREEMIELFGKVKPELRLPVFSPDEFRSHFQTPYRASHLTALHRYEMKHRKMFCRCCISRNDKGMLEAYQLLVEESDNLLENKKGEWISIRCMNEACDFDLLTPRPVPEPEPLTAQRVAEMQQMMQAQGLANQIDSSILGGLQAQSFYDRAAEQQRSEFLRQERMRQMAPQAAPPPSHTLDALKYAAQPLSKDKALTEAYKQAFAKRPQRKR